MFSKANYIKYIVKVVACVIIFIILLLSLLNRTTDVTLEYRHLKTLGEPDFSKPCKVPRLDPWDSTILKYYSKPDPLICKPVQDPLANLVDGYLIFNELYTKGRTCYWRPFIHNQGFSDFNAFYGEVRKLNFTETGYTYKVDDEFIEVICKATSYLETEVYRMHFYQIPKQVKSNITGKWQKIKNSSIDRPAVVMIGLDSMSRSNFIRQMPRTHRTLQAMGFHDMLGHIKIGDNTYVNWIAILTGKRGVTSKEFDAELDENWGICFDDFDLVWKNFSANNYVTLFAEDRPDIGTFNYFGYLCGFQNKPTDHYFRPYWLASYWSFASLRSTPYCYDARAKHKIQLDYLKDFIKTYHGKRHFAYWWIQDMNHDYLNLIGKTDGDFNSFFIENEKFFNETIVIVFSDHGHRYDSIRETVVGRMEARLPYLSIRVPPEINKKYPHILNSLKVNSEKMTTQFDLHETLLDIANGDFIKMKSVQDKPVRAYSLFSETPELRTCINANIPEDYCPCYSERTIDSREATEPANVFMKYLNELLTTRDVGLYDENGNGREYDLKANSYECDKLVLSSIRHASIRLPPPQVVEDVQTGNSSPLDGLSIQYRVVVEAAPPSNGVFEGLVSKNLHSGVWVASGEIERNNMYGNTSHCVTDRVLKKICHCIKKVS